MTAQEAPSDTEEPQKSTKNRFVAQKAFKMLIVADFCAENCLFWQRKLTKVQNLEGQGPSQHLSSISLSNVSVCAADLGSRRGTCMSHEPKCASIHPPFSFPGEVEDEPSRVV